MSDKQTMPFGPKYILIGMGTLALVSIAVIASFWILRQIEILLPDNAVLFISATVFLLIFSNMIGVVIHQNLGSTVKTETTEDGKK